MKAETSAIPEYTRVDNYPQALNDLWEHRAEIGAVVIRHCFDPEEVPLNNGREVPINAILPDETARATGYAKLQRLWRTDGYTGYSVEAPHEGNSISRQGFQSVSDTVKRSFTVVGFASLQGQQALYVSPGRVLRRAEDGAPDPQAIAAYDHKVEAIKQSLRRASRAQTFENMFAHSALLDPGSVALVVGHPQMAYCALRSVTPRVSTRQRLPLPPASLYTTFSYPFRRKR